MAVLRRGAALFLLCVGIGGLAAQELNLEFRSLEGWEPLEFDDIERHSSYSAVELEGESVLRIKSDNAASGLLFERSFDIYQTPFLEFRWRAEKVLEGGNARKKAGGDGRYGQHRRVGHRLYRLYSHTKAKMNAAEEKAWLRYCVPPGTENINLFVTLDRLEYVCSTLSVPVTFC